MFITPSLLRMVGVLFV